MKPMLTYLSSQIKQVHKGKTFSFSKNILEVFFKNIKTAVCGNITMLMGLKNNDK